MHAFRLTPSSIEGPLRRQKLPENQTDEDEEENEGGLKEGLDDRRIGRGDVMANFSSIETLRVRTCDIAGQWRQTVFLHVLVVL